MKFFIVSALVAAVSAEPNWAMLVMLDTPMPLGMLGMPVLDTLAMVLSHMLDTPIIHMLLSPLVPAPVLTPSLKDFIQSPRDLSIELVHNMASVRLKLMPMLRLSAPTQLVMDMAILVILTQLDMLAIPMHLDMLGMLAIPTQLDMLVIPTLLVMLDTLDIMPMARDLLMLMPMPK